MRIEAIATALAACCLIVIPSAAGAQLKPRLDTGSRIRKMPTSLDRKTSGPIAKALAVCIYQKQPAKVRQMLNGSDPLTVPGTAVGDKISEDWGMDICLGDEMTDDQSELGMKFPLRMLRAMMAEEDYLSAHPAAPVLPEGSTELIERNFVSVGDNLTKARAVAAFADCTVFNDVGHADALLRTTPGSEEEKAAARALGPALGACLTQGQSISLTSSSVRAYVADAIWTRFARPADAQAVRSN